jgi:hypothetical protein
MQDFVAFFEEQSEPRFEHSANRSSFGQRMIISQRKRRDKTQHVVTEARSSRQDEEDNGSFVFHSPRRSSFGQRMIISQRKRRDRVLHIITLCLTSRQSEERKLYFVFTGYVALQWDDIHFEYHSVEKAELCALRQNSVRLPSTCTDPPKRASCTARLRRGPTMRRRATL